MLDHSLIGKKYHPVIFDVEKQRLKFFAKATGQTDPIYFDESIAMEKGHPTLIAPPTFLTAVGNEQEYPYQYLNDLSIDMGRILHAGQVYNYHAPIYAGDTLTMESKILDMFEKKQGELQFVVFRSLYTNQDQTMVAESLSTIVVR